MKTEEELEKLVPEIKQINDRLAKDPDNPENDMLYAR